MPFLKTQYTLFVLFIFGLLYPNFGFIQADNFLCSPKGYTVLIINGMYTDESKAIENRDKLFRFLQGNHKGEKVTVEYLHNPSHISGLGDIYDVVYQKLFETEAVGDYDLIEMAKDANRKVRTQKILLVGHSQGNFYANSFYQRNTGGGFGIPAQSMGVYSVATPASFVAGGGQYMTSMGDEVINKIRTGGLLKVLSANIVIPKEETNNGHSFSGAYLKYQSAKIIHDIKATLDKLQSYNTTDKTRPCIPPPDEGAMHEIQAATLVFLDNPKETTKMAIVNLANATSKTLYAMGNGILDGLKSITKGFAKNNNSNSATVILATEGNTQTVATPSLTQESKKTETKPTPKPEQPKEITIPTVQVAGFIEVTTQETTVPATVPQERDIFSPYLAPGVPIPGASGGGGGGGSVTPPPPADTTAPVITVTGSNPASVIKDHAYADAGATSLDAVDGTITVVVSGTVDTATVGAYTITYTATDAANNVATATRTVNVVADTTAPVITLSGSNPIVLVKNGTYTEPGASATDGVDGSVAVVVTGTVNTAVSGTYVITYTATDAAGNVATATRDVRVSTYVYLAGPNWGTGNGDGRDWQAWMFNNSFVYEWTDTYVGGYLREQFKFQNILGMTGSAKVLRGIFNHDPRLGFETSDLTKSHLENSPQGNVGNHLYSVDIQWDATGYTYTIFDITDNVVYDTAHTNVAGINTDTWVGWNSSSSDADFKYFPSPFVQWFDVVHGNSQGLTGGSLMILTPYKVVGP